ncbi:SDR family oxidoreductase [Candidatus Puniceispirillum marinum]|uniref:Short-chain dehydrogenase/reductase SDR n=1 Tax=Puniceispirillum marinum (strain IMCC1322) TaxID=488538 RepID=D5BSC2_PUNMI|nr:SDR family NAD(P)-dependent oxidoreductase [Candidatus Puniceispirillum marinum]ADE39169.1 short-chain dehydrogenase/reductase SDR [Candidatus Puniceispirillum marinum IMCC1322]
MERLLDLSGQTFIVTGAARGIGLAISTYFHSLGARVCGWDLDDAGMQGNPVFADYQIADVSNEASVATAFAASMAAMGDVDGIVANAGINGPTKPLWDYSLDEWQQVIDIDLTGVFLSVQPVLRHLLAKGKGRIIVMSSVAGKEGNPGAVPYGAAKAGLVGYVKGLAREVLPSEITVNCIAPVITETDLLTGMSADYISDKKSRIPMGRFCTPQEVATMAAWIASPQCSFTTGQIFDVTGGRATW